MFLFYLKTTSPRRSLILIQHRNYLYSSIQEKVASLNTQCQCFHMRVLLIFAMYAIIRRS